MGEHNGTTFSRVAFGIRGSHLLQVPMPSDPWRVRTHDLMLKAAHQRATHYRQQAAELRHMAEDEFNPELRAGLLDLADKYDQLANSVSR